MSGAVTPPAAGTRQSASQRLPLRAVGSPSLSGGVDVKLLHLKIYYLSLIISLILGIITASGLAAPPWWDDNNQRSYSNPHPNSAPPLPQNNIKPWWENTIPHYQPRSPNFSSDKMPFLPDNYLWQNPNSEMWGMFLFGGSNNAMENFMNRMEYWGNRMEQWSDRWQGHESWNNWLPYSNR